MLSRVFKIKGFTDYSFGDVGCEDILEIDFDLDDLLPKGVKGPLHFLGVPALSDNESLIARFFLNLIVKPNEWVAISLNVGWWEILAFIQVEHESIVVVLFIVILNGPVNGHRVSVQV